ncbi:MAG: IS110 family transposase [Anaerolineae bacterium]|nr:MAG: IS110 family transposase [Anaerolineae bacterium]
MCLLQGLQTLEHVEQPIAAVDGGLVRLTTVESWSKLYPFRVQLPGFGLVVSMTTLVAIVAISRFPHAKQLVGYAGLGSSVHDSGRTRHTGRITNLTPHPCCHHPERMPMVSRPAPGLPRCQYVSLLHALHIHSPAQSSPLAQS